MYIHSHFPSYNFFFFCCEISYFKVKNSSKYSEDGGIGSFMQVLVSAILLLEIGQNSFEKDYPNEDVSTLIEKQIFTELLQIELNAFGESNC